MDFEFAPEHLEVAGSLARWLAGHYDLHQRHAAIAAGTDPVWAMLVELGIPALAVDELRGGLGTAGTEAIALLPTMGTLGGALAVTPFWSTAVAARAIGWGARNAFLDGLLPAIAAGDIRVALAFGERAARHSWQSVGTEARTAGDGITLHGEKTVVLFGGDVDHWLVSAHDGDEVGLFVVPTDAPGVRVTRYRTIDDLPAADLVFAATPVAPDTRLVAGSGAALLDRVVDYGAALLCGEAVGLMERTRDLTVTHLTTRRQFGVALASFQALRHRVVDVMMRLEEARSLTYLAAVHATSADEAARVRAVSAAKAVTGEAALFIGRQCVQLHGALGLTDEMHVSHALKRLTALDQTFGDSDHHLLRFAALPAFHANAEAAD